MAELAAPPRQAGPATLDAVVERIAEVGFCPLRGWLAPELTATLRREAEALLAREPTAWDASFRFFHERRWRPSLFSEPGHATNFYDCLGESPDLDAAVERLLSRPDVEALLARLLGPGHRLWFAQIRRAEAAAGELRLHQDLPGEVGLAVLLTDVTPACGRLVFLPGSHRWPRVLEAAPFLRPRHLARYLEPATGAAGDAWVFLNKTWHGRTRATDRASTVLIVTFLPAGTGELGKRLPPETRAALGPTLRRLTAADAPAPTTREARDLPLSSRIEVDALSPFSPWRPARAAAAAAIRLLDRWRAHRARRPRPSDPR